MTRGAPHNAQTRERTRTVAALFVLLLFGAGIASPGEASVRPTPVVGDLLEAERFDTADRACDPDYDGEHTQVHQDPGSSGGAHVFLPHSGCGIGFGTVSFETARTFTGFTVLVGGSEDTYAGLVRVLVDGTVVAEGSYEAHHRHGFQSYRFDRLQQVVPSGSQDLRIEFETTSGPAYGNLFIDVVGSEVSDETPRKIPDLHVRMERLHADPYAPSELYVEFRVENRGEGRVDGFTIDVWYDETYAGRITNGVSLDGGWVTMVQHPWPYSEGAHTIRAYIDPDDLVTEMDEQNNEDLRHVPAATPDAYIDRVWSPKDLDPDGRTSVRFWVYSVGTADMPPTTVEIRLGDERVATANTSMIKTGAMQRLDIAFQATPGEHIYTIHVDPREAVGELDERHNTWTGWADVAYATLPDLVATLDMPSLDGARYGDQVAATVTVRNGGGAPAEGARAFLMRDGLVLEHWDLDGLAPGARMTSAVMVGLRPGSGSLDLRAAHDGIEPTYWDNAETTPLQIGFPDLEAVAIRLDQEVPEEGRPINVSLSMRYDGTLALAGAEAVLKDGDTVLANWTLDTLTPDTDRTFTHVWNATEGEHTLRFHLIGPDGIEESVGGNNVREENVSVRAPTPAACNELGKVSGSDGLRESCRRVLLGEDDPLGPIR